MCLASWIMSKHGRAYNFYYIKENSKKNLKNTLAEH